MTHDFDIITQFCGACGMPRRALADDPGLEACGEENARKAKARDDIRQAEIAKSLAQSEASRAIDAQPIPAGTTWVDIRRAAGFDRWPA
jgi:hypothetical protein